MLYNKCMKHSLAIASILFSVFIFSPFITEAIGLGLPIGAKILSISPAICASKDFPTAYVTAPINPLAAPAVLISFPLYTIPYSHYVPIMGSWILGFYSPIPDPVSCNTAGVPTPTSPITMFGSSLPGF